MSGHGELAGWECVGRNQALLLVNDSVGRVS